MTIETPNWLQNGTYPARLDRAFIEKVTNSADRVFDGLTVSQRAAGANFTIDVSAGEAVIVGDDQPNQGSYFVRSTAVENVAVPASPPSGSRTDLVVLRINDPQAGGNTGNNATIVVLSGTTTPDPSSVPLATLARTAGESAILNAAITDLRPLGAWPYSSGTSAPPAGQGVEGDIYVQHA